MPGETPASLAAPGHAWPMPCQHIEIHVRCAQTQSAIRIAAVYLRAPLSGAGAASPDVTMPDVAPPS